MSIILDIISLAIIIICTVSSLKSGFMSTIIKKIAPLLSFFVAMSGAESVGTVYVNASKKLVPSIEIVQKVLQFILGFITVFVLSMVILYVIAWLFKLLNSLVNTLPVISVINKIVCVLLGLFVGYFNANFFVYFLRVIGLISDTVSSAISGSILTKFIANHSIFEFVAHKIAALF